MVCEKFGVPEKEVHGALLSGNPHDQLAIAYNLIVDNKRIEDETAKLEIKDFYVASSPPPLSSSLESPSRGSHHVHPERVPRARLLSAGGQEQRDARGQQSTSSQMNNPDNCVNISGLSGVAPAIGAGVAGTGSGGGLGGGGVGGGGSVHAKPPHKRAKWHLGIRSQSKPHDIMNEVYRAMKALDFVSSLLLREERFFCGKTLHQNTTGIDNA